MNYTFDRCLSSNGRNIISSIIEALVKGKPMETLKYFLPKTFQLIENIFNNYESNIFLINEKENIELTWYLIIFSKLVLAQGHILLNYKEIIISIFDYSINIINKNSYDIISNTVKSLLESLTHLYPIDYRLTTENLNQSFDDFLPIRVNLFDFSKKKIN